MSNKKARNIKILKYAAFARTFISSNSSLLMQLQLSYQELKFTEITVFMEECFFMHNAQFHSKCQSRETVN